MKRIHILALQFIVFASACHLQTAEDLTKNTILLTPKSQELRTELAISDSAQRQGLSGRQKGDFCLNCAMLFYYQQDSSKSFWMPDTYFPLDIFFLDQDLRIVEVERDMPAHPGREEPPSIARTSSIFARHVLEMRSDSPLAKELQKGMKLQFQDSSREKEILKNWDKLFNQD